MSWAPTHRLPADRWTVTLELESNTQAINRQVDCAFELVSDTQAINIQVDIAASELGPIQYKVIIYIMDNVNKVVKYKFYVKA